MILQLARYVRFFSERCELYEFNSSLKYYSLKYWMIRRLLGDRLLQENMEEYDAIIPVPIHQAKVRERGYNQSNFISKGISEIINMPKIFR